MAVVIEGTRNGHRGGASLASTGATAAASLGRLPSRGPRRALLLGLSAALLLSSCALGPGQAYLTIVNPNDPTQGTFNYTTIILDGVLLPYTVLAGASVQLPVLYNQNHTLSYVFVAQPNGAAASNTSEGPTSIFVPQGGYSLIGAKY